MALAAATAAAGWLLGRAGLPSSYLFGALVAGVVAALARSGRVTLPGGAYTAAQAMVGVVLGTFLDGDSLAAIADSWVALAAVTAATLALSVAAGVLLARFAGVDLPTAALGMVAGGASGIIAMANELDADDRLVALMQYLRILVIVLLTPVLAGLAFPGAGDAAAAAAPEPILGDASGWALTLAIAAAGAAAASRLRIPGGTLLVPMVLAAAVDLGVPGGAFAVPPLLREIGFALIGLEVGLRFTVATLRAMGRLLVPVLVAVGGVLAGSAALAVVLDVASSVSLRDAYLATTPGGLYAVVAVAVGAGADAGFVVAAQGLRLLTMVLLAPVVVRGLVHHRLGDRGAR